MDNNRLSFLLEKYHAGNCSEQEMEELKSWYDGLNYPVGNFTVDEDRMLAELKEKTAFIGRRKGHIYKSIYRYAAVLTGICLVAGLYFYVNTQKDLPLAVEENPSLKENTAVSTKLEDKNIIVLSDGSRVVLNGESKLIHPQVFNGGAREVTLIGEAYFDIARDTERPFIINTGKVRTRVLGTAFNIKSIPGDDDVVVTVTRGKVQVETQEDKVLAVLTADKQVHYHNETAEVVETQVDAAESISWAQKSRMRFESTAFGDIALKLSRIYGVDIRFKDPDLKKCPITASFSGTETLDDVLKILCRARGVSYQLKDKNVTISGPGCNTNR